MEKLYHILHTVNCNYHFNLLWSEKIMGDDILSCLRAEHSRIALYRQDINKIFFTRTSIYLTGMFIAVVAVSQMETGRHYIAVVLPYLLLYHFYNTIKYTATVSELVGYLCALENRMNALLGTRIYLEYSYILSNQGRRNWHVWYGGAFQSVILFPICVMVAFLFKEAICNLNWHWLINVVLIFFIAAGVIVNATFALFDIMRVQKLSKQGVNEVFQEWHYKDIK